MNEHTFVKSFHKRLDPQIKVWKIYDPYQGGVPDALLFGQNGLACFVEYKYVRSLPKRSNTIVKPALSAQQSLWLGDKISRGLLALVILGSSNGVVIFRGPTQWDNGIPLQDAEITTPEEAAVAVGRLLGVQESATRELEIQSVSKRPSIEAGEQNTERMARVQG